MAEQPGVVIVGSGLAGWSVARELRKRDADVPITLVSRDGGEVYAKPTLSSALGEGKEPEALVQKPGADEAARLGLTLLARTGIAAIDVQRRSLQTSAGPLAYRDLVLALGADPIAPASMRPSAEAGTTGKVWQVNDLDDYRGFRAALQAAGAKAQARGEAGARVVVVGGGLVGVEFAHDLASGGHAVEVVELAPSLLNRLLPAELGALLAEGLAPMGIRFHLGAGVQSIRSEAADAPVVVTLGEGVALQADLVVLALGLAPRVALARDAGIVVGRSIAVDALLRTSAAHVYALGDCAEIAGVWRPFVAPILVAARALGATLAGQPTEVHFPPMPVVVKTPTMPTLVLPAPPGVDGRWEIERVDGGGVGLLRGADGALLGFGLVGAGTARRQELLKQVQAQAQAAKSAAAAAA